MRPFSGSQSSPSCSKSSAIKGTCDECSDSSKRATCFGRQIAGLRMAPVIALACASLFCGCVSRVKESHTYVTRHPETGDVSLFRVNIEGLGKNTKISYKAALMDTDTIDQAFRAEPITAEQLVKKQGSGSQTALLSATQEMEANIAQQIRGLGHSDGDMAKLDELTHQLAQVRSLARRVEALETIDVPDAPRKKFVMVMASDPDEIFRELARVGTRQANEGATLRMIQAFADKDGSLERVRQERGARAFETLFQSSDSAIPLAADAKSADVLKAYRSAQEKLTRQQQKLTDYVTFVEALQN